MKSRIPRASLPFVGPAAFSFALPAAPPFAHRLALAFFLLFVLTFAAAPARAGEFRLDDGTVLQGELVSLDDSVAVIRNPALGEMRLPRGRVTQGLPDRATGAPATRPEEPLRRGRVSRDPAGYALFFTPTAFTPEQGAVTFRDFELLFLTFGYSPTSTTVISGGFLFPVSSELQILTLGIKQQLLATPSAALAVTANVTKPFVEDSNDEGVLFNTNLVASKRVSSDAWRDAAGVHGMVGFLAVDGESLAMLGLGAEVRLARSAKFIAEVYGPFEVFDEALMTLGIRLHSDRLSADIGGMRPLNAEGDFLFLPMLVINYRW